LWTIVGRRFALQGGFQILLDHRVLRTPARQPLVVPSRALAYAIAAEWEWQVRATRLAAGGMPACLLMDNRWLLLGSG